MSITRVNSDQLDEIDDQTDWERLLTMTDEEIEQAVADDPDQVLLDEEWFAQAALVDPSVDEEEE
jgi:hypothetical protein